MEAVVKDILIGMVGDLLVDRDQPNEVFSEVRDLLVVPDVLFGNLEANFTDTPHPAPSVGIPVIPRAHNLNVFAQAGFKVLSMANNHIVDGGHDAMLENRARLRRQGVQTCGAGENLLDARKPAILEMNGLMIAFLAYASVFPMGYEARSNVPGLVPLRAYDLWRPALENYHVPGTLPIEQTVTDQKDLSALSEDIAKARRHADLVFVSFHWGDFMRPYHLTDHEIRTARWCVDQGVDAVIGHHHHTLRGMEWYRGKPIFYGLGHFVFDVRLKISEEFKAMFSALGEGAQQYAVFPREGWPLLPLHPDSRMTLLAWIKAGRAGVSEMGFVPCRMRPDGRVNAVDPASKEGTEVLEYVERCNSTQGLNTKIVTDRALQLGGYKCARVVPAD
jgi:poly-gamma-glutamate capsule biosynthesis protein CapA/YwtB (metallophosphatase superfamily)